MALYPSWVTNIQPSMPWRYIRANPHGTDAPSALADEYTPDRRIVVSSIIDRISSIKYPCLYTLKETLKILDQEHELDAEALHQMDPNNSDRSFRLMSDGRSIWEILSVYVKYKSKIQMLYNGVTVGSRIEEVELDALMKIYKKDLFCIRVRELGEWRIL